MAGIQWHRRDESERCTAMMGPSVTGRRCNKEALAGDDRCIRHPHGRWERNENGNYPKFYRSTLRPTLLRRVEEALGQCTAVEMLDVTTELALTREAVSHRVAIYSDLLEAVEAGNREITRENLVAAAEMMRAGMQDVVKIADVAARVERIKTEVASTYSAAMAGVITTVLQAIRDVFEDDHRVARVETILRESLRAKALPGADGTDLTPDQDAIEMDDTVPSEPSAPSAEAETECRGATDPTDTNSAVDQAPPREDAIDRADEEERDVEFG